MVKLDWKEEGFKFRNLKKMIATRLWYIFPRPSIMPDSKSSLLAVDSQTGNTETGSMLVTWPFRCRWNQDLIKLGILRYIFTLNKILFGPVMIWNCIEIFKMSKDSNKKTVNLYPNNSFICRLWMVSTNGRQVLISRRGNGLVKKEEIQGLVRFLSSLRVEFA